MKTKLQCANGGDAVADFDFVRERRTFFSLDSRLIRPSDSFRRLTGEE